MTRKSAKSWLALLLLGATGCNAIQDYCIDVETSSRNCILSHKAWCHWSWCYEDLDYPHHFAKGFRAGYENILEGGKGCQPTLPPRWYWKPCYQTPEGRCKIAAWFDGFSHGAVAAQQDGYGALGEIPISPTARQNWLSRQATPNPACFDGMYQGHIPTDPAAENDPNDPDLNPEGTIEAAPGDTSGRSTLQPMGDNMEPLRPYDEGTVLPAP
jgi:hypothetical protein